MHILIESSNANYNWGDASMLHTTIRRLQTLFPGASLLLMNEQSAEVAAQYPTGDVRSVSPSLRSAWRNQRSIWHRLDSVAPGTVDYLATQQPALKDRITRVKMSMLGRDRKARALFLEHIDAADALVVSGGGFLTDLFATAEDVLNLVMLAHSRDLPVFMYGQGIGPIRTARLWEKARRALSCVRHIALREKKCSRPLLRELGVADERVTVTGDDAVGLAYPHRPDALGDGIGVNVRVAYYSEVARSTVEVLSEVLPEVAASRRAPLLPVPIAYDGHGSDVESIRTILKQAGLESDGGQALGSPAEVVRQAGRCRVVVTGSYHAGVFALSQGIPVVALSGSGYYDNKFHGLAGMFGAGCRVLRTDRGDFPAALREAIHEAWEQAEAVRPRLLKAAQQQVEKAKSAYARLKESL
jgi:colanic acid/amylovoran biosynthesis protein